MTATVEQGGWRRTTIITHMLPSHWTGQWTYFFFNGVKLKRPQILVDVQWFFQKLSLAKEDFILKIIPLVEIWRKSICQLGREREQFRLLWMRVFNCDVTGVSADFYTAKTGRRTCVYVSLAVFQTKIRLKKSFLFFIFFCFVLFCLVGQMTSWSLLSRHPPCVILHRICATTHTAATLCLFCPMVISDERPPWLCTCSRVTETRVPLDSNPSVVVCLSSRVRSVNIFSLTQ